MTRPWAPTQTITRTAPVTAPPVSPVSPFGKPASPFGKASPFGAISAFGAGGGGRGPFTPTSPFTSASPFTPRDPWRKPDPKRKRRIENRTRIILPELGPNRRPPERRFYLPYEEICNIYEWDMSYSLVRPGCSEDFEDLARAAARHYTYNEMNDCDELNAAWCIDNRGLHLNCPDGEHCTGEDCEDDDPDDHLHPMAAWPRGCPIDSSITYDSHEWRWAHHQDPEAEGMWTRFETAFIDARTQLLNDPEMLLSSDQAGNVAYTALKYAGYVSDDVLVRSDQLIDLLRFHLDKDLSVRNAFADYGVMEYGGACEDLPDLSQLIDEMANQDAYVLGSSELTFLTFEPDDVAPEDHVDDGLRIRGTWLCVDATYHSLYAEENRHLPLPWALGWREALFKPVSSYDE